MKNNASNARQNPAGQYIARSIRGAVIDDDNFGIPDRRRQDRINDILDGISFVITGNDYAESDRFRSDGIHGMSLFSLDLYYKQTSGLTC